MKLKKEFAQQSPSAQSEETKKPAAAADSDLDEGSGKRGSASGGAQSSVMARSKDIKKDKKHKKDKKKHKKEKKGERKDLF